MMDFELVLRTSTLLLLASLLSRVLNKATPATRHLVWHSAILMVLLAPALTPLAPAITLPLLRDVKDQVNVVERRVNVVEHSGANPVTAPPVRPPGLMATMAGLGSSAVGLWFVTAWLASGWKARQALFAPPEWVTDARAIGEKLGMTRPIEIRQSIDEGSPHVAGFLRSVVLVPASARNWTSEDRHAALVHELTHIRRGDRRTQALAQLACVVYWFNPLVWHAAAALSRERECACDAEVLRRGARPSAYATLLLELARTTQPAWTASAALSMARPSAIEGRLLTILGAGARAPWRTSRWLVVAGAVVMTGVVLGTQLSATQETATPAPQLSRPRPLVQMLDLDGPDGAAETTKVLVTALGDANAQVREKAALGLAFTPGADVIDPLLTALNDSDGQVRERAAIGLAFRRDPRIVAPLITAMSDSDSQVREKAAIALGASGDPRAFDSLQRAVHDPDSQVREKAVAGLLLLGAKR